MGGIVCAIGQRFTFHLINCECNTRGVTVVAIVYLQHLCSVSTMCATV
jgi:hypothetical protein